MSVAEKLWTLADASSTVLLPRFTRLRFHDDRVRLRRTALIVISVVTAAGALLIAIFAPYLVKLLFGPKFQQSATLLRLLLPGTMSVAIVKVLASQIAAQGRPGLNLVGSALAAAVNIATIQVLVPMLGARGASLSTSAAYVMLLLFVSIATLRLDLAQKKETSICTAPAHSQL